MDKKIKNILKIIQRFFLFWGFNLITLKNNLIGLKFYISDFCALKKQKNGDNKFYFGNLYPCLEDKYSKSGTMTGHYFHQDLYVARKIYENKPIRHIDIGSRTDGFVAHVATFRLIEILDIREQKTDIKNISFKQADLMKMTDDLTNCCDSISSLHAIEHFGLGRYGDPIDYNGHEKAIKNITLMLQSKGKFYFSVPIGSQRIEFNAHRIFSIKYLLELLSDYEVVNFSFVDDKGDFHENVILNEQLINNNCNCEYGCGIFELNKK